MLYSLNEICLIPAVTSGINSRSEISTGYENNRLPLFTAPMSCLIDNTNYQTFINNGFNVIIPRSVEWATRLTMIMDSRWVAVGLEEARLLFEILQKSDFTQVKICIDQANGHMEALLKLCKEIKDNFGDTVQLMTGNIARPETYDEYAKAGVDYVRCSIGSGNVCTTSVQTGMHYPIGSLIIECNERRRIIKDNIKHGVNKYYRSIPKIIADGGFKNIDQIVKAIALGADYVMLGEIIAKSQEACGKEYLEDNNGKLIDLKDVKSFDFSMRMMREYFGMSTEKAQRIVYQASGVQKEFKLKHTEGQIKFVPVEYPIYSWVGDFEHALRSSMSYAGARNLEEFIGRVKWDTMTPVTYNAYMK